MPFHLKFPEITDETTCAEPRKVINDEQDVVTFRTTVAYARITAFILFLSDALPETTLTRPPEPSPAITKILDVLEVCESWMERWPPHEGARRFGNLAFREWHGSLESESKGLLRTLLPESRGSCVEEVLPYFTGSFGSAQRLDYGTGHELSFVAFICCLYQLGILNLASKRDAQSIGLSVYPTYLSIIQKLVVRYTLEPAGSHGVWGLDDHFAMPYLLGAAQLSHLEPETTPTPASITVKRDVQEFRAQNLYFNAIGFINDVKKGPFWEHSPILYDISGIDNWGKISTGMKKMYNAEVLGKFPVVQHFPFGPCFFPFEQLNEALQLAGSATETNDPDTTTATDDIADMRKVQGQTKSLHVSRLAKEREELNADTPLPDDQPTTTRNSRGVTQMMPPTSVPWKAKVAQAPSQQSTAAPWTTGSTRPKSMPITYPMSSSRSPSTHTQTNVTTPPATATAVPATSLAAAPSSTTPGEQANTEGLEQGIGIGGMPGTKAPFAPARAIHPAVLESMRRRGESPPS